MVPLINAFSVIPAYAGQSAQRVEHPAGGQKSKPCDSFSVFDALDAGLLRHDELIKSPLYKSCRFFIKEKLCVY